MKKFLKYLLIFIFFFFISSKTTYAGEVCSSCTFHVFGCSSDRCPFGKYCVSCITGWGLGGYECCEWIADPTPTQTPTPSLTPTPITQTYPCAHGSYSSIATCNNNCAVTCNECSDGGYTCIPSGVTNTPVPGGTTNTPVPGGGATNTPTPTPQASGECGCCGGLGGVWNNGTWCAPSGSGRNMCNVHEESGVGYCGPNDSGVVTDVRIFGCTCGSGPPPATSTSIPAATTAPSPTPTVDPQRRGDASTPSDGLINEADYQIWKTNYGRSTTLPAYNLSDFNRDGITNLQDFEIWRRNQT